MILSLKFCPQCGLETNYRLNTYKLCENSDTTDNVQDEYKEEKFLSLAWVVRNGRDAGEQNTESIPSCSSDGFCPVLVFWHFYQSNSANSLKNLLQIMYLQSAKSILLSFMRN